jgi:hypothetical protein
MKPLRKWIESIVFAGMKSAPSDPLYLTNRSWRQKLRAWSVVAVPLLILIGAVAFALSQYGNSSPVKKPAEISSRELALKTLPSFKGLAVESNRNLEVLEARIEQGETFRVVGVVRNLTDHVIASADISCDLTDPSGTQLGSVKAQVEEIPAGGTKRFAVPVQQTSASAALVREINTR